MKIMCESNLIKMTIDFSTVPLIAISIVSRNIIARLLNPKKYLPTDNNIPRDYRGFAYFLDFNNKIMSTLVLHTDPTMHIFTLLNDKQYVNITIKTFQEIMEKIDRWDVIKKTRASLETDAMKYLEQQKETQTLVDKVNGQDQDILTLDIYRANQGLDTMHYDAFLLYADEDIDFVNEVVQKLETEYKLKLCLKDRDLVDGISKHDAMMKLIAERCNRLLIIVSPNFLKCSANKFLLNFAQALSIEKHQRILIPCIYKRCELPLQLRYLHSLDYNYKGMYDFWNRLSNSIRTIRTPNSSNQITSCIKQEIPNIFSDMYTSQPQIQEVETLSSSQEEIENYIVTEVNDVETVNNNTKKNITLLKWIRTIGSSKTKEIKENTQLIKKPITDIEEELNTLPSVDNLDSLEVDSSNVSEKKKNIFNRFKKKSKTEKNCCKDLIANL